MNRKCRKSKKQGKRTVSYWQEKCKKTCGICCKQYKCLFCTLKPLETNLTKSKSS